MTCECLTFGWPAFHITQYHIKPHHINQSHIRPYHISSSLLSSKPYHNIQYHNRRYHIDLSSFKQYHIEITSKNVSSDHIIYIYMCKLIRHHTISCHIDHIMVIIIITHVTHIISINYPTSYHINKIVESSEPQHVNQQIIEDPTSHHIRQSRF